MSGFGHRAIHISYHLIVAIFIIGAMTFMADTESRWYPVVSNVNITHVELTDNTLHLSGTFEKERGQCLLISASFWEEKGGDLKPLKLISTEDVILRPEGKHTFGEWHLKGYNKGSTLIVSVIHSCHGLWYTDSIFYKGIPI